MKMRRIYSKFLYQDELLMQVGACPLKTGLLLTEFTEMPEESRNRLDSDEVVFHAVVLIG